MPDLADYLAFKAERMAALREKLSAGAPPAQLEVVARVAGGSGVRPVRVREFTIVTDSGAGLAGYDLGPTAPEVMLSALASCLAHTFLIVAASKGIEYTALEVVVRGNIDFAGVLEAVEGAPIAPHNVHYEARIGSTLSPETLAAIQADVHRLCPVYRAFVEPIAVTGSIINT